MVGLLVAAVVLSAVFRWRLNVRLRDREHGSVSAAWLRERRREK